MTGGWFITVLHTLVDFWLVSCHYMATHPQTNGWLEELQMIMLIVIQNVQDVQE